jgi:hypothetical protein
MGCTVSVSTSVFDARSTEVRADGGEIARELDGIVKARTSLDTATSTSSILCFMAASTMVSLQQEHNTITV